MASGPPTQEQYNRVSIRIQDLYDESILTQKVEAALEVKNQLLTKLYNRRAIEAGQVVEELLGYADRLKPYVADTVLILNQALTGQGRALRGRPGHAPRHRPRHVPLRDVVEPDGRRCLHRFGRRPTKISRVIGILKAYTTVGSGRFPTKLDEDGEALRRIGGERGVTTGRDRRCGWSTRSSPATRPV